MYDQIMMLNRPHSYFNLPGSNQPDTLVSPEHYMCAPIYSHFQESTYRNLDPHKTTSTQLYKDPLGGLEEYDATLSAGPW